MPITIQEIHNKPSLPKLPSLPIKQKSPEPTGESMYILDQQIQKHLQLRKTQSTSFFSFGQDESLKIKQVNSTKNHAKKKEKKIKFMNKDSL